MAWTLLNYMDIFLITRSLIFFSVSLFCSLMPLSCMLIPIILYNCMAVWYELLYFCCKYRQPAHSLSVSECVCARVCARYPQPAEKPQMAYNYKVTHSYTFQLFLNILVFWIQPCYRRSGQGYCARIRKKHNFWKQLYGIQYIQTKQYEKLIQYIISPGVLAERNMTWPVYM